jgi:uncharacterized protein involved in high-affinity Fe2+ transport
MPLRGRIVLVFILLGVGLILFLNWEPRQTPGTPDQRVSSSVSKTSDNPMPSATVDKPVASGRPQEHPIGDEVIKNHIQFAAVWLESVGMDGRPIAEGKGLIHLEADVRSTADNPQGFAKDEFIPYLKMRFKLLRAGESKPIQVGELLPMIASDGLHYGANIDRPDPGDYQLTYEVEPPSVGGLGRHSDPLTGVAAWWQPFSVSFDWHLEKAK